MAARWYDNEAGKEIHPVKSANTPTTGQVTILVWQGAEIISKPFSVHSGRDPGPGGPKAANVTGRDYGTNCVIAWRNARERARLECTCMFM